MRHGNVADTLAGLRNVGAAGVEQYALVGEFGQIHRDRIVEIELALFVLLQHGGTGDLPRHRIDAEQGVRPHFPAVFQVVLSQGFKVDELPVAGYRRNHAGELAVVNVLLQSGGNEFQFRRIHADGSRIRRLQFLSGGEARQRCR